MSGGLDRSFEVAALLLRKTDFADSDLVLSVLTDRLGRISVMARGARASKRRFAGGIEPFHGLWLHVDAPLHGDLYRLRDTRLAQPRLGLVGNLTAMELAGRALGWIRNTTVLESPEPGIYDAASRFLSLLDEHPPESRLEGETWLGRFGLELLSLLGWALDLERCVRCGRPCPSELSALLDPRRGGLVCRLCGGARYLLSSELRSRMIRASRGEPGKLSNEDASMVLDIVEATLSAHPGVDAT